MPDWAVVIFRSTHLALKAEKAVFRAGLAGKLIPAPRDLSHDCGVALRIRREDGSVVESVLEACGVEYERIADLD